MKDTTKSEELLINLFAVLGLKEVDKITQAVCLGLLGEFIESLTTPPSSAE